MKGGIGLPGHHQAGARLSQTQAAASGSPSQGAGQGWKSRAIWVLVTALSLKGCEISAGLLTFSESYFRDFEAGIHVRISGGQSFLMRVAIVFHYVIKEVYNIRI